MSHLQRAREDHRLSHLSVKFRSRLPQCFASRRRRLIKQVIFERSTVRLKVRWLDRINVGLMIDQGLTGNATQRCNEGDRDGAHRSCAAPEGHRVGEGLGNKIPCSILSNYRSEDSGRNMQSNPKDHVDDCKLTPWLLRSKAHIH